MLNVGGGSSKEVAI